MESPTFKQVAYEQVHSRNIQRFKFNYSYHVHAIVAASASLPTILTIEQDADFLLEKFTGSVYGPCDDNGIPTATATDFPMPGIAAGAGHAGRGLTVRITDQGSGRDMTNGYVPVETLLTPGYGYQFHLPYPAKYFMNRSSKIRFDFRNRDTQAQHAVDITLNGFKLQMPEQPDSLLINQRVSKGREVA